MSETQNNGLLVLDKPKGITSRAVVDRAMKWFPRRTRIGHTGTLDPMATGVLVLCVGKATRLVEYVQAMDKVYHSVIRLGAHSTTDDAEGEIGPESTLPPPDRTTLERLLASYIGNIEQVPPAFSAAHVDGVRAHKLARKGEAVVLSARTVHVYNITLLTYSYPFMKVDVHCGKGTYIRSLARDLGKQLGHGCHVTELRRMRVGAFTVDGALALDAEHDVVMRSLLPMRLALANLPTMRLDEESCRAIRQGKCIATEQKEGEVALLDADGELVGIGTAKDGHLQPDKVLDR